jgi:hypothetical protein
MPFDINGTILTGGTSITATDASSNKIFQQLSTGQVLKPTTSAGSILTPMFSVGWGAGGWTDIGGIVPFNYTGGSGYFNVGGCYNTSTYAFTAPWTGLYLFKQDVYTYGPTSTITWYYHPLFLVNGSTTLRRPGGTPYRMRAYGVDATYACDSDCCELIYLTAGDYVQVYLPRNGTMQGYAQYSNWNGSYLSN